jgi:hypothetical protein
MTDQGETLSRQLERVIAALERMSPPSPADIDWTGHPAYVWNGVQPRAVSAIDAPPLDLIYGVDAQKEKVVANVLRHAQGHSAHDMLLWGSRGMGKSALLRAALRHAREDHGSTLALVQVAPEALPTLTTLFSVLRDVDRPFLVFLDDLGFEEGDTAGPRALRSWLEGGVEARPAMSAWPLPPIAAPSSRATCRSRMTPSTRATRWTISWRWPTGSACPSASTIAARMTIWASSAAMRRPMVWTGKRAMRWNGPSGAVGAPGASPLTTSQSWPDAPENSSEGISGRVYCLTRPSA